MSDYRFKDPTSAGKEFVVAKFNQMYNISVNYRFFKEKLDQLKRKYKKYKHLMKNSTGISVDPTTSVISASDSWWKDREVDRIVKSFKRKPPELWDVMQRCFVLYDVQSQSQYSLHQRREELLNDGTSRIAARSGSQGSRRKQSFETTLTDTMTGFREFQRQSLQQLRPNSFDEDDYNEFDTAVKIFESMELPNDTNFYWACIHAFKEERFWRKYFVDRAERTTEDNPTCGQCNSGFQQWGTPPSAPQWGTPPNAPQWSSPSNAPQWGTPPNAPQWGTPPNAPQWGTHPVPQWGAPQNFQQWGSSTSTQQWGPTSTVPQWGSSPTTHRWGSSQDAPQYIPPRNVQHGFSLETEVQTTTHEKEVPVSENVIRGVSPEFTNYASTSKASRPRRRGGLFNIWGTERGLNLNETQESDSTSDN
ncbi:hypothetical protein F2Q69_00003716 [Brassica cretica]|uniref:Myb/SANT-like domain-containing protein n=1 Tax=Brassica cretica TaxID=69181 RepID=A0A8S9PNL5_BRACR|nr:hypothetical protein F2Q69_00003716 [Brassica cretica]